MNNRPIPVIELECRRLAKAASLSFPLGDSRIWRIQRVQDPVLYVIKQEVPKRALRFNEQPGSAKKSLIQVLRDQHYRARKYFSLSNLLKPKAQIRPGLECSHYLGAAAPTTLSIFDAVQRRAIRLIGDPVLTCHLQPLSHR
nr:unnamed protein product [Callosobruchus chinensis]